MIDIEKIEKQSDALRNCVSNYKSSIELYEIIKFSPTSAEKDVYTYKSIMDRCEQTLIGQLKLMNIQNQDLLK